MLCLSAADGEQAQECGSARGEAAHGGAFSVRGDGAGASWRPSPEPRAHAARASAGQRADACRAALVQIDINLTGLPFLFPPLCSQMTRIYHRSEMWTHQYDKTDGHDNNWLVRPQSRCHSPRHRRNM